MLSMRARFGDMRRRIHAPLKREKRYLSIYASWWLALRFRSSRLRCPPPGRDRFAKRYPKCKEVRRKLMLTDNALLIGKLSSLEIIGVDPRRKRDIFLVFFLRHTYPHFISLLFPFATSPKQDSSRPCRVSNGGRCVASATDPLSQKYRNLGFPAIASQH